MRTSRIIMLVVGSFAALLGLGLAAGGGALTVAYAALRDDDGYFASDTERLSTTTYALTSEEIDLGRERDAEWADLDLATVRVRAERADGGAVFVGIAREADADAYLAGVTHDQIVDIDEAPFSVTYRRVDGGAPTVPPGATRIWVAAASGTGRQTVTWDLESGDWAVVVMNADGTSGVIVDASVGVKSRLVLPVGLALVGAGIIVLVVATTLIVAAVRSGSQPPRGPASGEPVAGAAGAAAVTATAVTAGAPAGAPLEPVAFTVEEPAGPRDRLTVAFRPLVALPILVVLALIGGFGWQSGDRDGIVMGVGGLLFFGPMLLIVFRQKYPRWWFDWNVGLWRFENRVASYLLLLRDEYPSTDAEQAVHLAVRYPDVPHDLNRWLPLVKWLLAVPHYVVLFVLDVAVAVLTLFAWLSILFTGRYPKGIFEFTEGVMRWHNRVIGYAFTLVTDRYPPFTLH